MTAPINGNTFVLDGDAKWQKLEKRLDQIPSLSPTVSKVVALANDIRSSPRDLMKVISLDPILTGKVLKLVNSAYFGIPQEITSLNRALILLGVNTIKNLALSTAVLGIMKAEERNLPLNLDEFWGHSLGTAVAAKKLGKALGVNDLVLEEYFICGLLHDVGKIPLIRFMPEEFKANMETAALQGINLFEAEEINFFHTHTEVGVMLAKRWNLGDSLTFAIAYHHDPLRPGEHRQLNQVVFVSNNFCKMNKIGQSGNPKIEENYERTVAALGMTPDDIQSTLKDLHEDILKAKVFLNMAKA